MEDFKSALITSVEPQQQSKFAVDIRIDIFKNDLRLGMITVQRNGNLYNVNPGDLSFSSMMNYNSGRWLEDVLAQIR